MLFNSFEYAIFFILVTLTIAASKSREKQIAFLLLASYFFYFVESRILILTLLFTTGITFLCGKGIHRAKNSNEKKLYLVLALLTTLGQLGLFKYSRLLSGFLNQMPNSANFGIPIDSQDLLLPLGISFFTFQSLSYVFDIYRGQLYPTSSLMNYSLFVSFFPQITSGPIIRAKDFLSQLHAKVLIEIESQNFKYGITLIGIGLVKKLVLADNIAPYTDAAFAHPAYLNSLGIILATIAFGVQLYCDFSGYCDIAIGTARILGFKYPINFNNPYLAITPSDFWHRWNITLSCFLRDYLYIPLGGNRKGEIRTHINLLITMTLCGLWHGATWNFIIWGTYQGMLLSAGRLFSEALSPFKRLGKRRFYIVLQLLITQYFIFLGWLIFRVNNLNDLIYCLQKFVFWDFLPRVYYKSLVYGFLEETMIFILPIIFYIILVIFFRDWLIDKDWIGYISSLKLEYWLIYLVAIILTISWFSPSSSRNFIYSAF